MPHKPTFREGVCRMAAPSLIGDAAWEHLDDPPMPHPEGHARPSFCFLICRFMYWIHPQNPVTSVVASHAYVNANE